MEGTVVPARREYNGDVLGDFSEINKEIISSQEGDIDLVEMKKKLVGEKDGGSNIANGEELVRKGARKGISNGDRLFYFMNCGFVMKLRLPPKAKNFVWRVLNGCIPTRVQLKTKHVDVSLLYSVCHVASESILHYLVSCDFAQNCWRVTGQAMVPVNIDATLNDKEGRHDFGGVIWDHRGRVVPGF
ncbi:hypothetical protein F8388_001601 [Cannabis sativa]|uniref:Reverse transcriptase zinc-binding domain-containing protein n=1 Tax=Cannabis sativa TaxID=3483 RepID=A0A7J6HIX8_CANSA|nr:hypothetical protein F8388_001601 [Cannabis sativa]